MRQIRKTGFMLIFFMSFVLLNAQNTDKSKIQSQTDKIFELSKANNYIALSSIIAYNGTDNNRAWKDSFNAEEKDELNKVKRISKKIKAFLDVSESYEFGNYSTKNESEGTWYVQSVIFKSGNQSLTVKFAFLKIKNEFLLGDID